jgi:PAS domain S-box-containing protein
MGKTKKTTTLPAGQEATLYKSILASIRDPIAVLDADLRVVTVNEAFYRTFKVQPQETEGRPFRELGNGQWAVPKLQGLLKDILPRHSFFIDFEVTHDFEIIGRRTMLLTAQELMTAGKGPPMIVLSIQDITERLQYQAHVRLSEIRYRRLFEAAKDGILVIDPVSRKITDANSSALHVFGFPSREILGKELWELGLFDSEQASHRFFRRLQQEGSVRIEDVPLQSRSGQPIMVELVGTLYEETGQRVIQCHVRDITQRKLAEQALHDSERRLTYALDATVGGLWDWNVQTGHVFYSPQWIASLGYAPAEVPPHVGFWENVVHPEDLPHVRQVLQDHFERRTAAYECQNRLRMKDGTYRWNLDRGKVVEWNIDGKPLRMVGTDIDITQQKRIEEELRLAVEVNQAVMSSMAEGLYTLDRNGGVVYMNPAAERLLGWRRDEILGRKMHDVIHYKHRDGRPFPIEECTGFQVLREGRVLVGHEDLFIRKNGSFVEVVYSSSPLRSGETINGLVVVFREK